MYSNKFFSSLSALCLNFFFRYETQFFFPPGCRRRLRNVLNVCPIVIAGKKKLFSLFALFQLRREKEREREKEKQT